MHCVAKYCLILLASCCCLTGTVALANVDVPVRTSDWYGLLQLGGPVVIILIGMSVIGLAVMLYKLLQFRLFSRRIFSKLEQVLSAWLGGDADKASEQLKAINSPLARLLDAGITLLGQREAQESRVREELTRQAQLIVLQVHSLLRFLEQIAYLAPLLGLLGTVLGMINVFQGLADQGQQANAGVLAGGIWEALLTTAVGLSVAIPFALIHSFLESRADTVRIKMEDLLTRLFTLEQRGDSSTHPVDKEVGLN